MTYEVNRRTLTNSNKKGSEIEWKVFLTSINEGECAEETISFISAFKSTRQKRNY